MICLVIVPTSQLNMACGDSSSVSTSYRLLEDDGNDSGSDVDIVIFNNPSQEEAPGICRIQH